MMKDRKIYLCYCGPTLVSGDYFKDKLCKSKIVSGVVYFIEIEEWGLGEYGINFFDVSNKKIEEWDWDIGPNHTKAFNEMFIDITSIYRKAMSKYHKKSLKNKPSHEAN